MSPLPPTRRGACPALARPMETGDGLLARLVPADGALSPAQFAGLAKAARAFGNGLVEVTARGSLQLRGLAAETVAPLNEAVAALAITAREGIAIDLSPLSGLDEAEIADARPLAAALRARLAPLADRLGPKVSVVVDGGGLIGLDALSADIRLRARASDGETVWELALGGDAALAPVVGAFQGDAAVAEAMAWLTRLAALGPRARMKDVLASRFTGEASASAPAAKAPHPPAEAGEADGRGIRAAKRDGPTAPEPPRRRAPSPVGAEMVAAITRGTATPAEHRTIPGDGTPPIGRIPLRDGTFAQGVALPFGQMEAETLAAFAEAAAQEGARDIRPAPGRVLLACGLTADGTARLARTAENLGFITTPDDPRTRLAACPGAPACRSAFMPSRAIADDVAEALAPILRQGLTAHLSACAKGCAHPAPAPLTLWSMDAGVALVREGKAGDAPEAIVEAGDLVPVLRALARKATDDMRPGEDARSALTRIVLPGGPMPPEHEIMLESQTR